MYSANEISEDVVQIVDEHITENGNIAYRFAEHLSVIPEKIAYIQGERRVAWKESIERTYRICHALQRLGIKKGDRVAILSRNSIEYSEVMSATLLIGACMVPLSTMVTAENIIKMLKDASAKVLVTEKDLAEQVSPSIDEVATIVEGGKVIINDELPQWKNLNTLIVLEEAIAPEVEISSDDEFNIIYTSGTTGTPKGILHKHYPRHVIANSFFVDLEVRNLISTPLYANMTIVTWYPTIYNGGTTVIMDKFNGEQALRLIEKHKITVAMFVPVQYERMLKVDNFHQYDLSSMKRKYSTSSFLSASVKKVLLDRFPGALIEFYALSEGGAGTILIADLFPTKLETVGKAVPDHELKIIDELGDELPVGTAGEIVGRSPLMSSGYINNEVLNKKLSWYDNDGKLFYRTGDIGKLDEDGFLYLLDRKKDVIISGGMNIYPIDLEMVLVQHPDVHEVAVIAAPSETWGETPVAFVVKKRNAVATGGELCLWANERLGKGQRIRQVIFRDDLPKNTIGKLLKRKLRDEYAKKHI
jgi:long-chain acyl-CoA synthetase